MAKLQLKKASTDVTVYLFIQDSSSTTGAGLTGLVWNSSGLTCYYVRPLGSATQLTLATQTVGGAHSDGGFVQVDATNMPGVYRLDLSDAICATGVDSVLVMLKGATDMAPLVLEIQLTDIDLNDGVRAGMTALPNAAAEAAGGLYTRGTGAGQINQDANGRIDTRIVVMGNGSINENTFIAGSISAAVLAADAIGASQLASDAVNEIADAVWDEAQADHVSAGSFGVIASEIAEIGVAGAGLTAIPWNSSWDAEVQSECNDALVALALDHLVSAAVAGTDVADNSIVAQLASSAATADWDTFVNTTDSLQAILDSGGGGPTAAQIADAVWDEAQADHVSAGSFGVMASEIADILVDTAEIGAAGAGLTAIPWNSSWDAEVQSEVVDALNVDTYAEPGQGTPPATATLVQKIGYLYKTWRNKKDQSDTTFQLYADDGLTVDQKHAVSEADDTATRAEMTTGP